MKNETLREAMRDGIKTISEFADWALEKTVSDKIGMANCEPILFTEKGEFMTPFEVIAIVDFLRHLGIIRNEKFVLENVDLVDDFWITEVWDGVSVKISCSKISKK